MDLGRPGPGQWCGGFWRSQRRGHLSGIWRDAHAVWRAAARDGTTAAYTLLGLARCLMVMGRETRLAGLAALWCTARYR